MERWRRAVVLLVVLALVGCTPSAGETPSPSPAPVRVTPSESPLERQQRLDFEAAEKSYRAFRKEYRRILHDGGADKATEVMRETAAGPYLAEFVPVIKAYKSTGYYERGSEKIVYVRLVGRSDTGLVMDVCEDGHNTVTYTSNKKYDSRGELRTATLEMRLINKRWKIWRGDGEKVKECS